MVLLDVNMSGRSGLDTLRRIRLEGRPRRSSCCRCTRRPSTRRSPLQLGARATPKDRDATELLAAIRIAASGGWFTCRRAWPRAASAGRRRREAPPAWKRLTEREWHVAADREGRLADRHRR